MDGLVRNAPAKPTPGEYRRERHDRRTAVKAHEREEMRAAKSRDHGKCRWPGCDAHIAKLRIDACHERATHRGMGGNPDGLRTHRDKVITLCQFHHRQYDGFLIAITPLTDAGFSGPVAFYRTEGATVHVASEKVIGVSSTRGDA